MTRTVAEKMGVKAGQRAFLMNAPDVAVDAISLPDVEMAASPNGEFDYLHLFVTTRADLADAIPGLKPHLAAGGALWVSWPKGRGMGSDLTLHHVVNIVYQCGLVESVCLSVNDVWSALKFTFPKPGKVYNNSHGELVRDDVAPR